MQVLILHKNLNLLTWFVKISIENQKKSNFFGSAYSLFIMQTFDHKKAAQLVLLAINWLLVHFLKLHLKL